MSDLTFQGAEERKMNKKSTESMESRRRRLLIQALVGFGIWQICDLALHAAPGLPRQARGVLLVGGVVGFGIWVAQNFMSGQFRRALKRDPAAAQALSDEGYQHALLRAHA